MNIFLFAVILWGLEKAGARGVDSVAPYITINEQSESNPDCCFYSSIASFAS